MFFSAEQVDQLDQDRTDVVAELQDLQFQIVAEGHPLDVTSRVREYLLHGVARRVGVIRRSIEKVFTLFPPDRDHPLSRDQLADVQINLHAFVMNLYGIYDNWAWAYVLRHNLESVIGDRRRIGLFNDATKRHLPPRLKAYLTTKHMIEWHEKYAKSYRDALAHRIPLYIPPAEFTQEEGSRYKELESEKIECIRSRRWERLHQVCAEQTRLGKPSFTFLHAVTEDEPAKPIILHPQMLNDAKTVADFGYVFLEHWHEGAQPTNPPEARR